MCLFVLLVLDEDFAKFRELAQISRILSADPSPGYIINQVDYFVIPSKLNGILQMMEYPSIPIALVVLITQFAGPITAKQAMVIALGNVNDRFAILQKLKHTTANLN